MTVQTEKQVQHLMNKAMNSEKRPPKETHIAAIIDSTLDQQDLTPFFRHVPRLSHLNTSAEVAWKALGVSHRLIHVLDHTLLIKAYQSFEETIRYLGRLHEQEQTVYGKVASLLSQLLVTKLDFHRDFKEFESSLAAPINAADLAAKYGPELPRRLAELQQVQIMCTTVVLDMCMSQAPTISPRKLKTKEFREQACLLWPMYSVLEQTVAIYILLQQLLCALADREQDIFGIVRQFHDQHAKLRAIYYRVRRIPYLAARLVTLNLDGPPPDVLSGIPMAVVQVEPDEASRAMVAKFEDDDDGFGSSMRRTLSPGRIGSPGSSPKAGRRGGTPTPSHLGPGDDAQRLRQEVEDQKAVIASLESYVSELTDGLKNMDARTLSEMQEASAQQNSELSDQVEHLQQELDNKNEQVILTMAARDEALHSLRELQSNLNEREEKLDLQQREQQSIRALMLDLEQQVEAKDAELAKLQQQLDQLRADSDTQRKQLGDHNDALQQQLNALEADRRETSLAQERRASELNTELEGLRVQLGSLMDAKTATSHDRDQLKKELEEAQADLAKGHAERVQLTQQLDQMQAKLDEASQKAITAVEQDMTRSNELSQVRSEKLRLLSEIDGKCDEITALNRELDSLRQELLTSTEQHSAKVLQLNHANDQLQRDLTEANARVNTLMDQDARVTSEVKTFQQQVATLQAELAERSTRINQLEQDNQRHQQEARRAQEATDKLNDRLRSLERQNEQERAASAAAAEKLGEEHAAELAHLKSQLQQAQSDLDAARKQLTSELEEAREEGRRARASYDSSRSEVQELREQLGQLRQERTAEVERLRQSEATLQANQLAELQRLSTQHEEQVAQREDQLRAALAALYRQVTEESLPEANDLLSGMGRHLAAGKASDLLTGALELLVVGPMLSNLADLEAVAPDAAQRQAARTHMKAITSQTLDALQRKVHSVSCVAEVDGLRAYLEHLQDLALSRAGSLEDQMRLATRAIDAAAEKIERLLAEAKSTLDEAKLNVHESILDHSKTLLKSIQALSGSATRLQIEIVQDETGKSKRPETKAQFYKRNSRWVEGLISAARAVGSASSFLVDTSDKALHGDAKLEEIMVCGQEIAASTAQLVSASRVKARLDSPNKAELENDSKSVQVATRALIDAVREACHKSREAQSAQDYLKLSLTQTKRLQMDSQVRCLELEAELRHEQERLRQLRKATYHLAEQNGLSGSTE